jgi:hypothetical protein
MTVFPNVPNAPGVPAVARLAGAIVAPIALLTADAIFSPFSFLGPQWGIFDQNGQPVIIGDSCVGVQFRKEYRISDYPIEQGGFASYNKVATPFDFKIVFTKGGTVSEKQNFLASIDAICASLALFQAVTPEFTYLNANPTHYDYDRSARDGATLLTVEVYLEEIRQTSQPAFTNTQSADGSAAQNGGVIQPQSPGSQTTTPAAGNAPGAITTSSPATALTNSAGNTPPASTPAPGSTIVYDNGDGQGPRTGTVSSVSGTGIGYNLTDGSFVGKNLVSGITPAGYTAVQ